MSEPQTIAKPAIRKREQIARSLRELTKTMSPGERLPSVSDLERQFGVATNTVMAVLGALRDEGLVVSRPRSGTYVAEAVPDAPHGKHPKTTVTTLGTTLGVLAPPQNAFFRHCVDELTAQAERRGLKLVCHYSRHGDTALAQTLDLVALHAAGYLLFSYSLAPVAAALMERGQRAVVVGIPPVDVAPSVPCVFGDHEHGASLATRRLLERGHRRIAYGHGYTGTDPKGLRRWRGYEQALLEAGLAPSEAIIDPERVRAWHEDVDALRGFFGRSDSPTGLVAWTDAMAVEVLHLLRRAGLHVPEDVSVVGYDNLPLGAHSHPPLDTLDGHVEVQVRHALEMLLSPRASAPAATVVVTPTLVCRESCARPRQ
jgi:DNA-binding LacI/PurR family transcriptional regulator